MININNLYSNISKLIFLIYLPFTFFVWYWMLDGFSGGITTILTISVFLFFILFIGYRKIDINSTLFFSFFLYCLIYISVYYVLWGDIVDISGRSLFNYHIVGILMCLISYIVGRNLVIPNEKLLIIIFILMSLKVFLSADLSVYTINLSYVDDNLRGLYLGLSDIFCIFALILVGMVQKNWLKVIVFLISILILFILNSRASLYIFIFSSLFYFILFLNLTRFFVFFLFFAVVAFLYSSKLILIFGENNRMFSLLSFSSEDQSGRERLTLASQGLNQIRENIILGDYGGVIKIHGDLGAYIHNILSYWQSYGVFAFCLCAYFFIYQTIRSSFFVYKFRLNNRKFHYIFLLSIYLFLMIVFARSYNWYLAWFVIGVIHNFLWLKHRLILKF